MITAPDDYFLHGCGRCARFGTPDCSARLWSAGLLHLRRICRDMDLTETAKYGHPCYMHGTRNIAILGAFRDSLRLGFFHAALLKDPDGVLERNGPNTRHPDTLRFRSADEIAAREPTLRAYLHEAMSYADQGLLPPREPAQFDLPDELIDALDADPELGEAFHALTPGRQRSYVIALSSAKKPETRANRISGFRSRILAGKGAQDR